VSRDGDLRSLFRRHLPQFDWQPIETGAISPGVPDSNACGRDGSGTGVDFWCEFKRTSGWSVGLDPFQVAWIHRRYRAGGRVWVAVRRWHDGGPRLGDPVDELWLIYGGHVLELAQVGLRLDQALVSGVWRGGAGRWDWGCVGRLLIGDCDGEGRKA
jgi:hypothetical protein